MTQIFVATGMRTLQMLIQHQLNHDLGGLLCWLSYLVCLKDQTHAATSTSIAEYIALSLALRDIIPIMELLEEFASRGYNLISLEPKVYCKALKTTQEHWRLHAYPKCTLIPKQSMWFNIISVSIFILAKSLFIPLQLTVSWLMSLQSP